MVGKGREGEGERSVLPTPRKKRRKIVSIPSSHVMLGYYYKLIVSLPLLFLLLSLSLFLTLFSLNGRERGEREEVLEGREWKKVTSDYYRARKVTCILLRLSSAMLLQSVSSFFLSSIFSSESEWGKRTGQEKKWRVTIFDSITQMSGSEARNTKEGKRKVVSFDPSNIWLLMSFLPSPQLGLATVLVLLIYGKKGTERERKEERKRKKEKRRKRGKRKKWRR